MEQIQTIVYGVLALVAFIEWRRHQGSASAWLCAAFMTLGVVVVTGRLLPEDSISPAILWARKAMIAILVLFPYCLYRFMRSFVRPIPWIKIAAGIVTAALVLGALALPSFPTEGELRPAWFEAYLATLLIQWVFLSGLVAVRLWRAGRDQPALARSRMRTMSLGAAGLALALVVAGEFSGRGVSAALVQLLALAAGPMMLVGFAPPPFLRAWWRRAEDTALRKAVLSLMKSTTTAEVVAILLPHAIALVAARGAVLETDQGELIAREGHVADLVDRDSSPNAPETDAPPVSEVSIAMGSNRLRLSTTRFTPFFGRDDIERVETVAGLAEFAMARNALGKSVV